MFEIQQVASRPGKSVAGARYLSLIIFVEFIGVFNLFLFNVCLICWYDYIVAIDKRENLC